jgi:GNAT superfamily N-acetyltransferase
MSEIVIALEAAGSPEATECLSQYYSELSLRFETGFDPVAVPNFDPAEMSPPKGWFIIARRDGEAVGCGALKTLEPGVGEVKRVWVAGAARGQGLAVRLMSTLEALARDAGLLRIRLDTNRTLVEAHTLYRKLGYYEIERYNDNPYADHWFEKPLS